MRLPAVVLTMILASATARAAESAPPTAEPVKETTKFEPELIYRTATLTPVKRSVYHHENHADFADQIYVILHFTRTYDYVHEVVIEPSLRTVRNNPQAWDKDHAVEQAYIESAVKPWLSVTAGKKAEFAGSGFIMNPSDLLNEQKDIFDPFYQKEGVVFSRVTLRAGDFSLGFGFIPSRGHNAREGKPWLTLSGEVLDADLKLQATHQESEKTTVGLSAQRFFGGSFELHTDSRYQQRQRGQISGNESPSAFSAYAGPNVETAADDDPSGFYLAGTRYVFTPQRTVVLEAIQNQSGLLPEEFAAYFASQRKKVVENNRTFDPATQPLGRHYVFLGYQDDALIKQTHLSLNALQNTDDKSAFVAASLRYHLSPITSVELAPTYFKGAADSEFGEMPFSSATYLIFRGRF